VQSMLCMLDVKRQGRCDERDMMWRGRVSDCRKDCKRAEGRNWFCKALYGLFVVLYAAAAGTSVQAREVRLTCIPHPCLLL